MESNSLLGSYIHVVCGKKTKKTSTPTWSPDFAKKTLFGPTVALRWVPTVTQADASGAGGWLGGLGDLGGIGGLVGRLGGLPSSPRGPGAKDAAEDADPELEAAAAPAEPVI